MGPSRKSHHGPYFCLRQPRAEAPMALPLPLLTSSSTCSSSVALDLVVSHQYKSMVPNPLPEHFLNLVLTPGWPPRTCFLPSFSCPWSGRENRCPHWPSLFPRNLQCWISPHRFYWPLLAVNATLLISWRPPLSRTTPVILPDDFKIPMTWASRNLTSSSLIKCLFSKS